MLLRRGQKGYGGNMFSKNLIEQIYTAISNNAICYGEIKGLVYVSAVSLTVNRNSARGTISIFFNSAESKEFNMACIELALLNCFSR